MRFNLLNIIRIFFSISLLSALLLSGCGSDSEQPPEAAVGSNDTVSSSCRDCHEFKLDKNHALDCTSCHQGLTPAPGREKAHENLAVYPAHPDNLDHTCGKCHVEQVKNCRTSLHFTLKEEVNVVRMAFGGRELDSVVDIPAGQPINSPIALVNDLLRRRCLRCHVYYRGDPYPATIHGTGCAACHLTYADGKLTNHQFTRPDSDKPCLHCHYGNYVGSDYHGRYEHDFHWDYRTPYRAEGPSSRPYGVEFHQLSADIHQQKGLLCIDCHSGRELMGASSKRITRKSCHEPGEILAAKQKKKKSRIFLFRKKDGVKVEVPLLEHPAHKRYKKEIHCMVCHAQWSFNDQGTNLLRQDMEDYDPWGELTVQSCYEVEDELETNLYTDEEYPVPFMRDKITGTARLGIWLKGYEQRRWEPPLLCRDGEMLSVCRPVLDLHLSYVNDQGEVIFDAISPVNPPANGLRPYVSHTTGKAGAFYQLRINQVRQ